MRVRIWEMIVFACLLVVAIIFASINYLWDGFTYFTASILVVFVGFFINNRIYYIKMLRQAYDEGLEAYFLELYNNGLITREQFENADERIIKGYYKEYRRSKNLNIILICGLAIAVITILLTIFNVW